MSICAPFRRSDDSYASRFQRSLVRTKEALDRRPKNHEEITASLGSLSYFFDSMRLTHGFDPKTRPHDLAWVSLHEEFKFRLPVWKAVDEVLAHRNELYVEPPTTMKARAGIFQMKISLVKHRLAVVELAKKTEEEWFKLLGGYVFSVLDLVDRPPFDEKSGFSATRLIEGILPELITAVSGVYNNGNPITATQEEVEEFVMPKKT